MILHIVTMGSSGGEWAEEERNDFLVVPVNILDW